MLCEMPNKAVKGKESHLANASLATISVMRESLCGRRDVSSCCDEAAAVAGGGEDIGDDDEEDDGLTPRIQHASSLSPELESRPTG